MDVWCKIRNYLILWAAALLCLVLYVIVKHRTEIWGYIVGNVTSMVSGIFSIVLVIALIVWLIKALF